MEDLKPIPTPWRHRLRHLRVKVLPAVVFVATLGVVIVLWRDEVIPTQMEGEVVAAVSDVTGSRAGTLVHLESQPFASVREGDLLAIIETVPARQVASALAVLRAEIELARMGGLDPILDHDRNRLNWIGLQQDWLEARARLASLRVNLLHAASEHERFRQLAAEGHLSEVELDRVRSAHDALAGEEREVVALVDSLDQSVSHMRRQRPLADSGDVLQATIDWQLRRMEQLEAELLPVEILSPISGVITRIHRNRGDYVREGELILTVRGERGEHIVGYVRQPAGRIPGSGDTLEVVMRSDPRQRARVQVIAVGPQYEPLVPALIGPIAPPEERALPLLLTMPAELPVRPGEIVDLRFVD